MPYSFEKPTLRDIEQMQRLVQPYVENGTILYRDQDEMAATIRSYHIVKDNERLIGFGALHIYSPTLAEVRSFFIDEEYRGRGVGSMLLAKLEEEGRRLGVKTLLALTYKEEFFKKLGFVEIAKDQIPEHKIWADCIKCKHFPICNEISLIKTISQ